MGEARRGDVDGSSSTALATRTPPESGVRLIVAEEGPEFLTADEAAGLLRVAPKTVRAYAAEGKIPGARIICGKLRVHRPTLVASFTASPDRRPWRR
jgi:excisionase family DNA binding protein